VEVLAFERTLTEPDPVRRLNLAIVAVLLRPEDGAGATMERWPT
jgi:hypothetical protein